MSSYTVSDQDEQSVRSPRGFMTTTRTNPIDTVMFRRVRTQQVVPA